LVNQFVWVLYKYRGIHCHSLPNRSQLAQHWNLSTAALQLLSSAAEEQGGGPMRWEFHSFGRQSPEAVLALHDAPDLTVGQGISWGYSKQTGKSSVLWSSNRLVSMSSMVWSKKRGDIRIYHADSKKKQFQVSTIKKK
jgi:hypothetical protein